MANADCTPDENLYFSCKLRDRNTEVFLCLDDDHAYYKYGKINERAELEISEPFTTLNYIPSSRNGTVVTDEVEFWNGRYKYEIVMGFIIPFEDIPKGELFASTRFGDTAFGEISVSLNGEHVNELHCRFDSIVFN